MTALIQCVPNFSEGRHAETIEAIVDAVRQTSDARLADWSADTDHNRLVVTFVGAPGPVRAAALAAAAAAFERIDLTAHAGVHPRLGALDVLPFVPLSGITLAECAVLARAVGEELAARHSLPVFFYEAASADCRALPEIRKTAFRPLLPDCGPPVSHPTAGASVVGAREPLLACNVNLATADLSIARTIVRELRVHPMLPGIRALGLPLPSRAATQVSMNLVHPAQTPLLAVFQYIQRRASELGTRVLESEIIGGLPGSTAFGVLTDSLQAAGLKPGQVLWESWPGSADAGAL